jgi:hypothetical protein
MRLGKKEKNKFGAYGGLYHELHDTPLQEIVKSVTEWMPLVDKGLVDSKELAKQVKELEPFKEKVEELRKKITELLLDYSKLSEEDIENERIYWQIDEPEELSEKLKNNGLEELNEVIMRIIEKWEVDAKTHFVYLVEVSKLFNEKKVEGLKEEIEEKSVLLEKRDKRINEEVLKSAKLQEGLEQKEEDLRNRDKKLEIEKKEKEELKWQLYLERKTLPTLPKKENKLKQLGVKIKSNFQQLIKWGKNQKQEFISRIEVKAK